MPKHLFFYILMCCNYFSFAQSRTEVVYRVIVNTPHEMSQESSNYVLNFDQHHSVFWPVAYDPLEKLKFKNNSQVTRKGDSLVIIKRKSLYDFGEYDSGQAYLDYHITYLNTNQVYFNHLIGDSLVNIKKEQNTLSWDIVANSRDTTIAGLKVKKAFTYFMGRDYVAYFAPEIKTNAAPFKFRGLPGLIVSLKSRDGFLDIELKQIDFNQMLKREYQLPKKTISFEEYKESLSIYTKKSFEVALEKLRKKDPDGDFGPVTLEFKNFIEIPGIPPLHFDH